MIVLDTNVIAELFRPAPAPAAIAPVTRVSSSELYTRRVALREVLFGASCLPQGERKHELLQDGGAVRAAVRRPRFAL